MENAPETLELFFDGKKETCTLTPDRNDNELLYVAENGKFVKFSADGDLEALVDRHNEVNSDEVEVVYDNVYSGVITFDEEGNVKSVSE